MVLLPFDVHNGGGYFIFLSIFASLYLCHVQCANVDISNRIAPKPRVPMAPLPMMPMVATMVHPTARVRLQWDPGIPKNKTRCPSAVGFTTHPGYAMNVNIANVDDRDPVDRINRPPAPMSPIDPTPASTMSTENATTLLVPLTTAIATTSARRAWDPGIDASVGWQLLFHYSHPVLSRPTMPNIDT